MVSKILEPSTAAGTSSDVTVTAGSTNTVAMYVGISADNLLLPAGEGSDFLLPDGVSVLLLSPQAENVLGKKDYADIQLKDPDGEYFDSGLQLRHNGRFKTLGPGVWRLKKAVTPNEFGFQSE